MFINSNNNISNSSFAKSARITHMEEVVRGAIAQSPGPARYEANKPGTFLMATLPPRNHTSMSTIEQQVSTEMASMSKSQKGFAFTKSRTSKGP